MSDIKTLLDKGTRHLDTISTSPRLDAEILLCHCLERPRSYLFAWPHKRIDRMPAWHYARMLVQRRRGEPVAYLTGEKEFWSLPLTVNTATLIPRPETEDLVALALTLLPKTAARQVADLGTGSGAIALAIAHERPLCRITAVDNANDALTVARHNAQRHGLKHIEFKSSHWFSALQGRQFDLIVSNPPYIRTGDPDLEASVLDYEPGHALISGPDGLEDLIHIADEARRRLVNHGYLIMEHGIGQEHALLALLDQLGYQNRCSHQDLHSIPRIISAQLLCA